MPTRPDRFPILQARPAHDLINSVSHAQKELAAIELTPEQKRSLDRWVDVEFVCAALSLEGAPPSREQVENASNGIAPEANAKDQYRIVSALHAISTVRSLAEAHGQASMLTPALLTELHSGSDKDARSSQNPLSTSEPAIIARSLAKMETACHWFTAESFAELHPAEQASIALMRLLELKPFERGNTRTALAASSVFTLRSGFPPVIIEPDMEGAFRAALDQGMRMNTKPMVDLVTEALLRTLNGMTERVRGIERR
ncbi:MAG TPA: Fic family protein [Blastocatellia bacterium]|nr:Fic family protein [Blastocatellia bacterium]